MQFDIENKGQWFYFDKYDETKGGVCLRVLTVEEAEKIDRLTSKTKVEYKRGNRFEYKDVNNKKFSEMMWDYCIVDWKNVKVSGQDYQCTKENKYKLMSKSIDFANFVTSAIEELTVIQEIEKEDKEKN